MKSTTKRQYVYVRGPNGLERVCITPPPSNKPTLRQKETLDKLPMLPNQWRRVDERVRRGLLAKKLVKAENGKIVRAGVSRFRSIDEE